MIAQPVVRVAELQDGRCRVGPCLTHFIVIWSALLFLNSNAVYAVNGDMGGGDGSMASPWLIQDLLDFHEFTGDPNYWDDHTHLETDINLALADPNTFTTALIALDTDNSNYSFEGTPFTGSFNGNNHIISNLTINTAGAGNDFLGLFGRIDGSDAEVKNLGLENVNITGGDDSVYLGGLCGWNEGTVNNCNGSGSVTSGYGSGYFGGLCGMNYGNIRYCYFSGSVSGGGVIGGLCGMNKNNISNCNTTGLVIGPDYHFFIGGLCGRNEKGSIINCYTDSSVIGGNNAGYFGGLCGWSNWDIGSITNCYTSSSVTGGDYSECLGGLCGANSSIISNCYATGSVTGGYFSEKENMERPAP